jgi:Tol biopolymer transport system component
MTRVLRCAVLGCTIVLLSNGLSSGEDAAAPGDAKLFAEGVISKPGTYGVTFMPDGTTLYVVQPLGPNNHSAIWQSRLRAGRWTAPEAAAFSGEHDDFDPFLSPDGSQLFFASTRPTGNRPPKNPSLWSVERTESGWSSPKELGETVNGSSGIRIFPTVATNGTLYFTGRGPGLTTFGQNDIYYVRRADGQYGVPENLGAAINSPSSEYDAWVAPDESFLVFVSDRPGGIGQRDFYTSTRSKGTWTPARNLGSRINSAGSREACCPAVSPDRQHFYFVSDRGGKRGLYRIGFAALGVDGR